MLDRQKTSNELRCFCSRHPLLATYGLTQQGKVYLHIKVYKQGRIYGEVVVEDGKVSLHCRECLRWHSVKVTQPNRPQLVEEESPPAVVA
jgi:hypothetical protein